jgi:hypothetical protein
MQSECKGIGEMHVIIVTKKELERLVKFFPYRTFETSIAGIGYDVPNWAEQTSELKQDPLQFWYENE